ncbi:MAG: M67 family metallopeptidase [Bacteroidota bacterium]|nr:M67 family metallopeptidase [Bacteroidota bacterium]
MILIEQTAAKEMINDALESFPDECCGFLFGIEKENERTIIEVLVVNNAKDGDKKRRFEISSKDYLKAEQFADDNNLQLLGVYHSHPDHPAIPSETDRIAAQPYFSYIIISVTNNKFLGMRSWQLNNKNQFEEEKILEFIFN